MKYHLVDAILSLILLGLIGYQLQKQPTLPDDIPLYTENQEVFSPKRLSIIHFWAPWSKPSLRQLQLFHRFTQTHTDIELIAAHSIEENPSTIQALKRKNGWYFSSVTTPQFPEFLPYTILVINDQKIVYDRSIYYEQLLERFDRDY